MQTHWRNLFVVLLLGWLLTACSQTAQPTPTLLPTARPIAGWHKLANAGVEIWLPESFIGGTEVDMEALTQRLTALGPEFAKFAEIFKQNGNLILVAVDTQQGGAGGVTNLLVGKEVVQSTTDITGYLDSVVRQMPNQMQLIQNEELATERYPTGRILVELNTPQTGHVKEVMYVIKHGNAIWQFAFSAPAAEFDERWPVFEQSISTVSVPYATDTPAGNRELTFMVGLILMIGAVLLRVLFHRFRKPKTAATAVDGDKG